MDFETQCIICLDLGYNQGVMPEFKRSRLERKKDEQITKKTVFLGFITLLVFLLIVIFGLPLLIQFSIFLGNTKSKNITDKENVVPPLAPRLVVPYEATSSSEINIEGFAESGSVVKLLKDDEAFGETDVLEDGKFLFENIELKEGENFFSAIASKEDSGSSDLSKTITVVLDLSPPELTMTNPSEESLVVDFADYDIVGKSEAGVNATVNGKVAVVDFEGNFKLKIQLNPGKNDIEIVVKDAALNETRKKISITYDI